MDSKKHGIIFALLSALFVSGYVVINRHIYSHYDITALEYSLLFAMSGGLFGLSSLISKMKKPARQQLRKNAKDLFVLGLAGNLAVGIFVAGQQHTTAVNASILMTTTIASTALFSYLLLKERLERSKIAWIMLLFTALYIGIVGFHSLHLERGDMIVLSSVLFFGFGNAYSRKVMQKMGGPHLVPDARLSIGGIIALTLSPLLISDWGIVVEILPLVLIAGLFYWLTMQMFARAVFIINANNTIVLNNMHIFVTSAVGVLVLSEQYSVEKLIGSTLAIVAIYMISKKR